jgi:hypothetical protein
MAEGHLNSEVADDFVGAVGRARKAGGSRLSLTRMPTSGPISLLEEARILRRRDVIYSAGGAAARRNKCRRQPLLSGMEFIKTEIIAWNYRPHFTRTVDSARELQAILEDYQFAKSRPDSVWFDVHDLEEERI